MKRTMTGIPIEFCPTCQYEHAVTREHCANCSSASLFLDPDTKLCVPCEQLPNQLSIFDLLDEVAR